MCLITSKSNTEEQKVEGRNSKKGRKKYKNEVYKVLAAATSCVDNLGCRTASCTSQTPPTPLPCCRCDEEKAGEDYDDADDEVDDEDSEDGSTGDNGGGVGGVVGGMLTSKKPVRRNSSLKMTF